MKIYFTRALITHLILRLAFAQAAIITISGITLLLRRSIAHADTRAANAGNYYSTRAR